MQLSYEELPYDLVSLAKTEELPDGCARDAWQRLTSEYNLTEGEDNITLLSIFQQNQVEDVRTNITVWLTSMAIQVNKLRKLDNNETRRLELWKNCRGVWFDHVEHRDNVQE